MSRTTRNKVGALLREAMLYPAILRQRRNMPGALFMPSQGMDDGAARLRAFAIADELKTLGWRTLTCPKHLGLSARQRIVRLFDPNIIVMQTARHPLNRPHLFSQPVVIDIDDADYISPKSSGPIIDALKNSVGAIAGSREVARVCRQYNKNVRVVWTGTPPSFGPCKTQASRPPIVAWAASTPVGRVQETKFLRAVLQRLATAEVDFTFRVYCDDGSQKYQAFLQTLIPDGVKFETFPYLNYPRLLQSLETVAVGLAPVVDVSGFSGGASFGKILTYVDKRIPVVTHPVIDHPLFFQHGKNGFLCTSADEWADVIVTLLNRPDLRQSVADAAWSDFVRRLSTKTAATLVDTFLRKCISNDLST